MDYIVRGGNWYFDALNAWRVLDEVTLPELTFNTEDFVPGGHNMAVAWPEEMQPLKATIKLKSDDPRVRGLCGREPGAYVTATYYENLRSFRDGTNRGRVILLKGLLNSVKPDARKGVKASGTEYEFSTIVRYEDVTGGAVTHRFDQFAGPGATIVGGVALFAEMATNLAISGGTAL
ncbi:phage major tail tube protein [Methylocystis sp. WRRC1]|uniref:phage major tail tube protein n=1 Tax=unclassified Methylocystis TaxID=2625913 RepID=UPI0001F86AA0|nr:MULTISPECIES: phage major tail tube protein [unclassified Methylocystis]MCC3246127.1 phage major tail tube protein [Methylocystis sp. WRRC1]